MWLNYETVRKGYKTKGPDLRNLPDPDKHQKMSFIKSGIRIAGYICIPFSLITATILLVASEIVGVIEELV